MDCEYKVHLFDIKVSKDKHITVFSTIDDIQLPYLYRGIKVEQIDILDSWMCLGDTSGFKPVCEKPVSNPKNVEDNTPPGVTL